MNNDSINYKKALDLLELNPSFTAEELQRKYKGLAKKYHPDNGITGDEQKFIAVKEAFEFLSKSDNLAQNNNSANTADKTGTSTCPYCNGTGTRREKIKTSRGYFAQKVKCTMCNGTGQK